MLCQISAPEAPEVLTRAKRGEEESELTEEREDTTSMFHTWTAMQRVLASQMILRPVGKRRFRGGNR